MLYCLPPVKLCLVTLAQYSYEVGLTSNIWTRFLFFDLASVTVLFRATGRAPNTKRLNLEAVGVELDKTGAVKVNCVVFLIIGCYNFVFWNASVLLNGIRLYRFWHSLIASLLSKINTILTRWFFSRWMSTRAPIYLAYGLLEMLQIGWILLLWP